jgi:hypothetical protein
MEVDAGLFSIRRRMSEVGFNVEADVRGGFQHRGRFVLAGGGVLVKAIHVILCPRSSTGEGLHKSIQLRVSHLCHVFQPSQRNISTLMLFSNGLKCMHDST